MFDYILVFMWLLAFLEAFLIAILIKRWLTTTPEKADFETPGFNEWHRLLTGTHMELVPLLAQLQSSGVPARVHRLEWMFPHAAGIMGVAETSAVSALEVPLDYADAGERIVAGLPPLEEPKRVLELTAAESAPVDPAFDALTYRPAPDLVPLLVAIGVIACMIAIIGLLG